MILSDITTRKRRRNKTHDCHKPSVYGEIAHGMQLCYLRGLSDVSIYIIVSYRAFYLVPNKQLIFLVCVVFGFLYILLAIANNIAQPQPSS